ncbi:MAG: type II toxin-antitoxin system MqsR family toxin [Deltaproteobacteria bacterium]|nr:type II toxin-antitoxin system MqsR family toxin [Deltaproteobacteria bacterium]
MAQWLSRILKRIKELAAQHRVRLTYKALYEMALIEYGLDYEDVCHVLSKLTTHDFDARIVSETTKEWMYVFKPGISNTVIYLKVILREDCVVVSFHEDEDDDE